MTHPVHVIRTRKTILAAKYGARVVRIFCTDADAAESSGSEEEHADGNLTSRRKRRRVKHVQEILFKPAATAWKNPMPRAAKLAFGEPKKFRGVRQRRWDRYSAEIRDPGLRKRRWLGTFDTAEEAAAVYDLAALQLKGNKAVINFPARTNSELPAPETRMDIGRTEGEPALPLLSPRSVLPYGDVVSPFENCLLYGDVDTYGFSVVEELVFLPELYLPAPAMSVEEIEYGEIDDLSPLDVSAL